MKPFVLCFSGHDPVGGSGIQADIEAIRATGARALSIITALTVQNSAEIKEVIPQSGSLIERQAMTILEEIKPAAIKAGVTVNEDIVNAICAIKHELPEVPLILDPVLSSGSGQRFSGSNHARILRDKLVPLAFIITPNQHEFQALNLETLKQQNILLTGTDNSFGYTIIHKLLTSGRGRSFTSPRLNKKYHGSGCTLAAALSSFIAQGYGLEDSVKRALDYTWDVLDNSPELGLAQILPLR